MTDVEAMRRAFAAIYEGDVWTNGSGPGSRPSNTIEYRGFVDRFIAENRIASVTDFGCGDWQFSRLMDWDAIDYLGLDLVPAVIDANRVRFARDNVRFELFEGLDALPGGDLLLCKEVLQHLPNATITDYLDAIRRRYRYALITNAVEPLSHVNIDIGAGDWRPLRLDQPPFDAPGAAIFTYFPTSGSHIWKNGVYLMLGH